MFTKIPMKRFYSTLYNYDVQCNVYYCASLCACSDCTSLIVTFRSEVCQNAQIIRKREKNFSIYKRFVISVCTLLREGGAIRFHKHWYLCLGNITVWLTVDSNVILLDLLRPTKKSLCRKFENVFLIKSNHECKRYLEYWRNCFQITSQCITLSGKPRNKRGTSRMKSGVKLYSQCTNNWAHFHHPPLSAPISLCQSTSASGSFRPSLSDSFHHQRTTRFSFKLSAIMKRLRKIAIKLVTSSKE